MNTIADILASPALPLFIAGMLFGFLLAVSVFLAVDTAQHITRQGVPPGTIPKPPKRPQ